MFAKPLRLLGVVALAWAIVWLTREHLLPTPKVSHEPPPHYRSTPPPPPTPRPSTSAGDRNEMAPDDLTEITGIGPVFAARLAAVGVDTFRGLSEMDTTTLADTVGTSPTAAADWVSQARARVA